MHKFLMVDDEELIRTALSQKIDWAGLGFEFLEPCANGRQALAAVKALRPDVVMTDICMPQMDGLELCRILAREHPDIRVVVLSGHDDFEYARESLRNRVVDYLLKPLTSEELTSFLAGLSRELGRPRPLSEAETLRRLLEGEPVALAEGWCAGRLVLFPSSPEGVLARAETVLEARVRPWAGWAAATQAGPVVHVDFVMGGSDSEHAALKAVREGGKLLAAFRAAGFAGCGAVAACETLSRLGTARDEAALATHQRLWRPLLSLGVVRAGRAASRDTLTDLPERLATVVREGDRTQAAPLLDELKNRLASLGDASRELVDVLARMVGPGLDTCPDAPTLLDRVATRLYTELDAVADRGASLADRALARFREQIAARLAEPDLAIDEVSRQLQVSPSYLAKLLRRRWDTNFSRYLREARVSRAKELLAATNLTTNRIAEQTGYNDYRYFSSQFKRSAGVTPSGYRSHTRAAS